jgi:hypothetical protein
MICGFSSRVSIVRVKGWCLVVRLEVFFRDMNNFRGFIRLR